MNLADLVIIVPSRGRPGNVAALLDAWDTTAAGGFADLVVAVDDDDPRLEQYLELELPAWCVMRVGPRRRLGPTLNEVALEQHDPFVGFLGDDHRPRSLRWDERLVAALHDRELAVVYGNDLVQGAALPTAVALDRRIVVELGYMVPPGMLHLYLDNYWKLLGERLGTLTYLADVIIEHAHPTAGRAEWDDGYRENNAPELYAADEAMFRRWIADHLADALTRLENLRRRG